MTCHNDWFVNYVEENSPSKVVLGDDNTQVIKGHGDVQIQLSNGDQGTLKDVLWIPKLARNLLSVGCITDQHMSVEFFNDYFVIKDLKKQGEQVASGVRSEDGLYKLMGMSAQQALLMLML